jgi:uncharacterized protein (DUF1778 family)
LGSITAILPTHYPYESAEGGYQGATYSTDEVFESLGLEILHDRDGSLYRTIVERMPNDLWSDAEPFALSRSEQLRFSWEQFCEMIKHKRRYNSRYPEILPTRRHRVPESRDRLRRTLPDHSRLDRSPHRNEQTEAPGFARRRRVCYCHTPKAGAAAMTEVLSVRVSDEERALLLAASELARTSLSEFIRRKALDAAEMDVLERRIVTIAAKDWRKFEAWADRPAKKIKGLADLARRAPTWQK